ncbi:MAG: restriction endonuclease subunit M [Deltaproteobacteria bacterium RIFOXYD12_FULL_50_9]|nr:MAG: restriction endonuclease subunit M [Deltaproteobacteria bacterium RIFOXYD12_FULL_50_9]
MTLSLNKPKLDNLASDIWKSAERLRGKFKSYEYQSVILPIIVIRRLECVLIDWRTTKSAEVLKNRPKLTEKELAKLVKELELNPKQCPFSNTTDWTLHSVYEEDHALLEENFRAYINGFSQNVDDIIEHFNYRATIGQMVKLNRLAPILNQYKELALGPDQLSGLEMGYIYEELLRRFSEQSGDEAGEHFTPREVVRLMVELLDIPIPDKHLSIYDPASGTGGMLSVAKEHPLERADTPEEKARVEKYVTVHGQELSPTNYAVCQADLLIKNDRQATVHLGNSLIPHDQHSKEPGDQWPEPKWRFNRMLSNPPFGVTWGGKDGYEKEARKLEKSRYQAGMPRVNDGALLFLETTLAKMAPPEEGGSRIAIIFNGSPLSNGDCGSGESEIRRWILENDWLDAIVMLPDQLFYNTGIFTYIWLLRNDKPVSHQGRVVFWQTDEHDQPAIITEPYEKAFTAANVKKEQEFHESNLSFRVRVKAKGKGKEKTVEFIVKAKDNAAKKFKEALADADETLSVEWTHRHYVQDDEYIPHGEEIAAFLKREIAKPIIRWDESPQLGYEILPNKYFYRYQPPPPAKELLAEFWRLEKEAEKMLEGLAR